MPGTPGNGSEFYGSGMPPGAERAPVPESNREAEPQPQAPAQDASFAVSANDPSSAGRAAAAAKPAPQPVTKDELRLKVERLLEENLWELYLSLPPEARNRFREAGDRVATEMRNLIDAEKVKPVDIHKSVDTWLKTIPKVNPWFLLQESKIKTDGVLALMRERHGQIE